jgi:hypothetical protein
MLNAIIQAASFMPILKTHWCSAVSRITPQASPHLPLSSTAGVQFKHMREGRVPH